MAVKKRFLLFLGIIIPFLAIFLMSQNTFATSLSGANYGIVTRQLNGGSWGSPVFLSSYTAFPISILSVNNITSYYSQGIDVSASIPSSQSGKFINATLTGSLGYNYSVFAGRCSGLSGTIRPENVGITAYNDSISCEISSDGTILYFQIHSYIELTSESTPSSFHFTLTNPSNYLFSCSNVPGSMATPCSNGTSWRILGLSLDWTNNRDPNTALLGELNNGVTTINNTIENHYEAEQDAYDNISDQSTSDISGAENQQTTNLIGVLSSFLTQLSGFTATNCQLSLPFPQFIGGTQTVNICQGKDVLGNFITVVGTLAMVAFYIPLAIVLLRMILNEIRSFTNG